MADGAKAVSLSAADLSNAMERAVEDVLAKHNLKAAPGLAFGPNTIIGRQLLGQVKDVAAVERAAADVAAHVEKSLDASAGATLRPAAILSGGHILVGFVPETRAQA